MVACVGANKRSTAAYSCKDGWNGENKRPSAAYLSEIGWMGVCRSDLSGPGPLICRWIG